MNTIMITDLRIGNWVKNLTTQENIRLTAEDLFKASNEEISIKPIVLTDDWFNYFGFISNFHDQIGLIYTKGVFEIINPDMEPDKFGICLNGIDVYCEYVHELQNFYHVLIKKEL